MINDKLLYYSEDQAETAVGAHDSDNIIDMGINKNAFGTIKESNYGVNPKEVNHLNILVTETFTTSAGGTLAIKLVDSADGITYGDTEIIIPVTAVGNLVIGTYWVFKIPNKLKRYSKMEYTIATGDMDSGKLKAWIGDNYEARVMDSLTA